MTRNRIKTLISMNQKALRVTIPLISEAIADTDFEFAIDQISNAESQLNGLRQLVNKLADISSKAVS